MFRVDVIIPCWNMRQFVAGAARSVLEQTVPSRPIVVDDASTDGLVAEDLPEGTLYIRNQYRLGTAGSRNRGVSKSTASVLAFLDADDVFTCDKIASALVAIGADRHGASVSGIVWGGKRLLRPVPFTLENIAKANMILTGAVMTREAFMLVGGYDSRFEVCEDLHFALASVKRGVTWHLVQEPQVMYRKHSGAKTRRLTGTLHEETRIIRQMAASP